MNQKERLVAEAVKLLVPNVKDQCYPVSEAAYHLLGGKTAGYVPMRGNNHWWLRAPNGRVLDYTAAQYPRGFDYKAGRGGGFMTKVPSKRAQKLLDRLYQEHRELYLEITK